MGKKIIELKNLSKNFGDNQVLKGIDLNIYENEFLTLLGPSGCGKTTTLRIVAGFEEASSGEVLFDGIDISTLPPYKREVNTVFQKYALFPHMNVFDNIAFGLKIKKMEKDVIEQKVLRILSLVGLEGFEKRNISQLSGGQQQRVAIARAIVNNPKVLIADEPTGNLDPDTSVEIIELLERINEVNHTTILVVTHDKEIVQKYKKRTILIEDGCIKTDTSVGGYVDGVH